MNKESEATIQGLPKTVDRPWVIYFMSIWSFFGIGSFLTSAVKVIFREIPDFVHMGNLGVLALSLTLVVCVFQMRREFIIIFGLLCIGLALWQSLNLFHVLLSENPILPIIYFQLFYIIPSIILATLALRSTFLTQAANYREFKNFESMKAASLKAMRR